MAFINEKISLSDRELYVNAHARLKVYYPRDWTIDREKESVLFEVAREREDMYDEALEGKYGQYIRSWWVFIWNRDCIELEFLQPKELTINNEKNFIARNYKILGNSLTVSSEFFDLLKKAMQINKGFGVYLSGHESYDVVIDFSEIKIAE